MNVACSAILGDGSGLTAHVIVAIVFVLPYIFIKITKT